MNFEILLAQEEMPTSVGNQVVQQLPDVASLSSVITVMDDVIGIAASVGGQPDVSIDEYLHRVLQFPPERGLISSTAREKCQLKHVRSLWRQLHVERGRRLKRMNKVCCSNIVLSQHLVL